MKRLTRAGAIAVLSWMLAIPYTPNACAESKTHRINVSCSIGPILQVSSFNKQYPDSSEDNTETGTGTPKRTELGLKSDGSLIKVRGNVDKIFQQNETVKNTPKGPVKLYTVTA